MLSFSKHKGSIKIFFLLLFINNYINGQEINNSLFQQTLAPVKAISRNIDLAVYEKPWDKQNFDAAFKNNFYDNPPSHYPDFQFITKAYVDTLSVSYSNHLNFLFAYKNYLANHFSLKITDKSYLHNFLLLAGLLSGYDNFFFDTKGSGMWRFSYINAIRYKLRIDTHFDYRFCPIASTNAALDYYKDLMLVFNNNEDFALAAFLSSAVMVKNHQQIENLSQELIYKLCLFKALLFLEKHISGFSKNLFVFEPQHLTDTISVTGPFHFEQISLKTNIDISIIKQLNPVYRELFFNDSTTQASLILPKDISQYVSNNIDSIRKLNDSLYFGNRKFIDIDERLVTGEHTIHIVKRGETLSRIAQCYSNVSIDDIMRMNNLSSPDRIREGQKLKIPKK